MLIGKLEIVGFYIFFTTQCVRRGKVEMGAELLWHDMAFRNCHCRGLGPVASRAEFPSRPMFRSEFGP